jgi:hypothetical protein
MIDLPDKRIIDIRGKVFGQLTVVEFAGMMPRGCYWECVCNCGSIVKAEGLSLKRGKTKRCKGCAKKVGLFFQMAGKYKDEKGGMLVGMKFGRLTVEAAFLFPGSIFFECVCDCGKTCFVTRKSLLTVSGSNSKKSCGCLQREAAQKAIVIANRGNTTHGMSKSPEFKTWLGMIGRCTNKNDKGYKNYGGRGIKVCDSWINSFSEFFIDMGSKPGLGYSIERKDVNGDYCPENCVWATAKVQGRNRRYHRLVEHQGQVMTMSELAEKTGFKYGILHDRIVKRGWDVTKAVTTPNRLGKK